MKNFLAIVLCVLICRASCQFLEGTSGVEKSVIDWSSVGDGTNANEGEASILGSCACDVKAGSCDANCCCDGECTDQEKTSFSGCLPTGVPSPALDYCVPKSTVVEVNLPSSSSLGVVEKQEADQSVLSELLCVANDRNPNLGAFFTDPGPGSSGDLSESLTQHNETFEATGSLTSSSPGTTFKVGDPIPVVFSGAPGFPTASGYFVLPAAIFSRECEHINPIAFRRDYPSRTQTESPPRCQLHLASLASACGTDFRLSPKKWVTDLSLASTPQSTAFVQVVLNSIQYSDGSAFAGLSAPDPVWNGNECSDMVGSLGYVLTFDEDSKINSVDVDVVLVNATANSDGSATIFQEFSAIFLKETEKGTVHWKSGAPGYWDQFPVLGGVLEKESSSGQKKAISMFSNGLPMLGSNSNGECSSMAIQSVQFGMDSISRCTVGMNLEELKRFCSGTTTGTDPFQSWPPIPVQLLDGLFLGDGSSPLYVGKFGDANPNDYNQWIEVNVNAAQNAMQWDDSQQICSRVPSGFTINFLTASVGAQNNPQKMISYVGVEYNYASWQIQTASTSNNNRKDFPLQFIARFVPMEQTGPDGVKPEAPPLLPRLSTEIFYPFISLSHASINQAMSTVALLLFSCTLSVVFSLC
ncbi:hypothetical protein BSKO_02305 [Bryopsis sp. KO-2023]|nr:hypothetical protein BSKO_02305 [Bryopsis sp. KO-2023]